MYLSELARLPEGAPLFTTSGARVTFVRLAVEEGTQSRKVAVVVHDGEEVRMLPRSLHRPPTTGDTGRPRPVSISTHWYLATEENGTVGVIADAARKKNLVADLAARHPGVEPEHREIETGFHRYTYGDTTYLMASFQVAQREGWNP